MNISPLITVFLLITSVMTGTENASSSPKPDVYEITFEEGYYRYDYALPASSLENKYLGKVTIKKNDVIQIEVRGSTFPDSAAFYQLWYQNHRTNPIDHDVTYLYDQIASGDSLVHVDGFSAVFANFISQYIAEVPVLPSGRYHFDIGIHKEGKGPHGLPYAPRLLGGDWRTPFSPLQPAARETLTVGGYLVSLNYNKAQGEKFSNGINIHDGRRTGSGRDSEGCLTINPNDWGNFIAILPNPESWSKLKCIGVAQITRLLNYVQPAPTPIQTLPSNARTRIQVD